MNEQQQLPPGYSLRQDICNTLIFIQKNGSTLRRANREPIYFSINDRDQAKRFAWWHHGEENRAPTTN